MTRVRVGVTTHKIDLSVMNDSKYEFNQHKRSRKYYMAVSPSAYG